jgi:hypothetical protein
VIRTLRQGDRLCACPMRRLAIATFLLLLLLPTAIALAGDNPSDLLVDACRDEKVDGTYSQRTYKQALSQLPADSDQYTACRDVINRARLAALDNRGKSSGGSSGSTSSGSTGGGASGGGSGRGTASGSTSGAGSGSSAPAPSEPTPSERKAVSDATTAGAQPVRIGNQLLRPGAVGNLSSGGRALPTPLIGLLGLLAAGALAVAGAAGWNRVLARRAR